MGYVAVTAGEEIIERAEQLFEKQRIDGQETDISVDQLDGQLGRLTAQAMSEGGLYAPRLAALAVKQAQGDTVEAAFLLRAYRSTLERFDETVPVEPSEMLASRRVSPAFKDVPGGQILGPTKDYTQRLLDFDLIEGDSKDPTADWETTEGSDPDNADDPEKLTNVMELLREEGLIDEPDEPDELAVDEPIEPTDTTREPVTHPPDRDAVLQELARGETGAVTALGYSALRGYGQVHPTLAEVRVGRLPVTIEHPYTGDEVTVTHTEVSESEAIVPVYAKRDDPQFAFGYGLTFGRNERKAIGMTILDASIQLDGVTEPAENPEFVLDVVDGMDSFGFIEHLKLPHYVTFQSTLDRIRSIRERKGVGQTGQVDTEIRDDGSDDDSGNDGSASGSSDPDCGHDDPDSAVDEPTPDEEPVVAEVSDDD
ncbi:alpha-D-ribose 1-methylphosphonate 5-triphosphate synthase subunit PhnI [Halohasta litchfieldiae]|jgi:alpha-D-ribose 1-methylphosphonate 5-triphosphate synthase subunit PhnI|uniref:Alpha-D-ribose 1-methylphosphonate 5-triphosphate synthase subunit PhnI n=1 Tax=Halohasta litchfieldiae TaxID=1073996 RepID=A0A1H6X213_9EURY|nr:carbon-phosphorus lyase complex subunit PhnI [Halohasta litchfieldiae]ATW88114.1 alpha-D-ribose 1-methylphosphonate 5-triphosphate synthase subunit PhnI [Halohasta litchfieldiae]SEJ23203.1 alpha-D-ribose 1-methylphosphonate 5-triphosphate synthase subunit PhnI [Halohasta litchfieldiae]